MWRYGLGNAFGMGFGGRMTMSGYIADRIGDESEGYLLGGMGGGMVVFSAVLYVYDVLGRRGGGGNPSNEFGWNGNRI